MGPKDRLVLGQLVKKRVALFDIARHRFIDIAM